MKYPEAPIARAFAEAVRSTPAPKDVVVEGAGVHWNVIASHGERRSLTSCFSTHPGGTPEYLTKFMDAGDVLCGWGRTRSSTEAAGGVDAWMGGMSWDKLLARFPFIERRQRQLQALLDAVFEAEPDLRGAVDGALCRTMCDLFVLTISAGARSVETRFYGKNEQPDATVKWDGTPMAQLRVSPPHFPALVRAWLEEDALPGALVHPGLELLPVATYYEQGRPIEGEFIVSWDKIEKFYERPRFGCSQDALDLIAALRQRGFDHTLRAGQSMATFILSRSRRHGLRPGQASVSIVFHPDAPRVRVKGMGDDVSGFTLEGLDRIEPLVDVLRVLEQRDID
ncbi:MAG: hypothetical protein H6741_00120 [Alphaproteobacteria bacterium]|nr:hypothetical protein [Alphaproteobacteria bacterium]MCB9791109.1 hypothetical protein [Alphaproteobacteria bacterium]